MSVAGLRSKEQGISKEDRACGIRDSLLYFIRLGLGLVS